MKTSEALIHCDYHTSNIFIGEGTMKVIDMEYAFYGPVAFDLGYLFGNLISQYVCADFRTFPTPSDRESFQNYILNTIADIYTKYCRRISEYWDRDAKEEYKGVPGLKEFFFSRLLSQTIGFCSTANLFRIAGEIDFPEYSAIADRQQMKQAVVWSALMDRRMLINREHYGDIHEWLEDMRQFKTICDTILLLRNRQKDTPAMSGRNSGTP